MAKRECYVVTCGSDDHDVARVCETLFDVLGTSVETLRIDAYSDFTDQMPDDVRAAEAWLRARGLTRGEGDPGIGIVVERSDEIGWAIARAYTPWAIRTAWYDAAGVNVATLDDGGRSITVNVTDSEAAALGDRIGPESSLVPLSEWTLPAM